MFTPKDPEYQQRVRDSFACQTAMSSLGIRLQDLAPGQITLTMPFNARFAQQHGFMHAGIITTALDSACGYAAFSLMPNDAEVLSVEIKTNLLSPAAGEGFRFFAEVIKPGRTITFAEAKAYARQEQGEKLVATMSATLMAVRDRS